MTAEPRTKPAPETKAIGNDVTQAFEDFHRTFASFRDTNDERLYQIETRLSSDVVTEEKLARIDRALDDNKRRLETLVIEKSRPQIGRGEMASCSAQERMEKFSCFP